MEVEEDRVPQQVGRGSPHHDGRRGGCRAVWLFEMFALRDLKKYILDADGRGDEGTRRLKAVLQKMKGPPAELTKLLGDGLDAEEILRSRS